MGTLSVTETTDGGRTNTVRMNLLANDFEDATALLIAYLWRDQSLAMTQHVVKWWMRGERYADHSVNVRYYVPGTVGHWFTILYVA
jgi:hypothetical protein